MALPAAAAPFPTRQFQTEAEESIEARFVDPLQGSTWDAALAGQTDATIFHTAAWARVLHQSYQHHPVYLQFFRGKETVALLPLMEVRSRITGFRAVSLPFSDFCSPLIGDLSLAKAITGKLTELLSGRGWKYLELRGGEENLYPDAVPGASFYGHRLALGGDEEELWRRLASPVRRAIRKAVRSGLSVEVSSARPALAEFYQLHSQTRRRHGLPPQPWRFFRNLYQEIIAPGRGFLILARVNSQPAAAAMFLEFNDIAIYKFGASDDSLQELRANNLVMWEAIRLLLRRGCRVLQFGRTELGNKGLRQFKLGWGTVEEVIRYFRFSGTAPASSRWRGDASDSFYNTVFRRLPLLFNQVAGTLIYPHLD